jgi:protein-S-isoprenylcysteine O-methyltransferase Ste14
VGHPIAWVRVIQDGARRRRLGEEASMGRQAVVTLYVLALITVVVVVDLLFFRNHFWERLLVNVGIVMVFAAFGLRFLRRT